ncbi:hypothetical protein IGI57_002109 [Enterococcus sp. DIV0213j]|jgi:predicted tellurium resistance membrane protein TerC
MIFGQLGLIGGILFLIFLFNFAKNFVRQFAFLVPKAKVISSFILFDMFFSSIQSSYLAHYSVVALLFIFMMLFNNKEMENYH